MAEPGPVPASPGARPLAAPGVEVDGLHLVAGDLLVVRAPGVLVADVAWRDALAAALRPLEAAGVRTLLLDAEVEVKAVGPPRPGRPRHQACLGTPPAQGPRAPR